MALYQYNDWITLTDRDARLARLRLHIQEASAMIGPDTSGPDHSQSSKSLKEYVEGLRASEKELDEERSAASRRIFSRARLRRN